MHAADGKKFRELLRAMSRVLPCQSGAELDNPMLDVYWLALKDWSLEDFEAAYGQLVKTAKFMPRPCDFEDLRKAGKPSAGEAWARALEHAADLPVSGGFLQERSTGDELLDAAARAVGGYTAIANATERDLQFMGQRFCEHYEAIGDREEVRESLPKIASPSRARVSGPRQLIAVDFNRLPGGSA
jgi:hypothetical protein